MDLFVRYLGAGPRSQQCAFALVAYTTSQPHCGLLYYRQMGQPHFLAVCWFILLAMDDGVSRDSYNYCIFVCRLRGLVFVAGAILKNCYP